MPPISDNRALERKLQQKQQTIDSLREFNRALEVAMEQQKLEMKDIRSESSRLYKKNKEKGKVTTLWKHEIDDRIEKEKKIESLKNVLDWGDVGKRHEVENLLKSKVFQLDEATTSLQSTEERVRGLESKNRILSGKLAKERKAREEAEASFDALKAEADQKMAEAYEESERTTAMYQSQNSQLQSVLKAVTEDLKKEKEANETMYRKLGNVNVILTLSRMVALKRAEMNQMLHDQLETANEKLKGLGGTAVASKWMYESIRKGFTHKLQHMADERQQIFEEQELLNDRKSKYEAETAALEQAQDRIKSLEIELAEETARMTAQHEEAMADAEEQEAAKVAEKQIQIDRMIADQQEVVNVAVKQLKDEYDTIVVGLEGERDDLKTQIDRLQTDIREWQEKLEAAQAYRAQLQKSNEMEVKGLNEQIDHLEDLCRKAQAAQDQAEANLQIAESDRKAAEAAAEDAKLHAVTLSTDLERLRGKLQALNANEQARIESLNRAELSDADPKKQMARQREKIGGLELTVRSQMEDLNRLRESGRHMEEDLHKTRKELLAIKEKVGMKDDLLRDRERKIEQMRDALKSKFDKLHEASLQKEKDMEELERDIGALKKDIAYGASAHEATKQELADMSALRQKQLFESCQGITEAMIQRAVIEGEANMFRKDMEAQLELSERAREEDLVAWRGKAQKHAASAKHREEELSKKLETTLFEAGQAQSRAKTLDSQLGEAQKRASDLKKEEEDLTKWKADLFEKVDQLRSENEELENGLRLSAEEIERLQKRIMYLDARRDELKEQAAALAAENEAMRADKRVAALETELESTRQELASVAAEGMAKEEEMKDMKKKFAQVMDKMGGLQMGTTEATAAQTAGEAGALVPAGEGAEGGQAVATPALPPMGKKPATVGQHARQFDLPNAEEIHKYAVHLGIDPMVDKEFLWLAEESCVQRRLMHPTPHARTRARPQHGRPPREQVVRADAAALDRAPGPRQGRVLLQRQYRGVGVGAPDGRLLPQALQVAVQQQGGDAAADGRAVALPAQSGRPQDQRAAQRAQPGALALARA
jgi:chromosome segregation ATPase